MWTDKKKKKKEGISIRFLRAEILSPKILTSFLFV